MLLSNQKTNEDASEASIQVLFSLETCEYCLATSSSAISSVIFGKCVMGVTYIKCYEAKNKRGCEQSEHPSSVFFGKSQIFWIFFFFNLSNSIIFGCYYLIKKQMSKIVGLLLAP